VLGVGFLAPGKGTGDFSASIPGSSMTIQAEAPEGCDFPPGTSLAFAGEASLHEAGLAYIDDPDRDRRGDLYVTADAIHADSDPRRDRRRFCLLFPPRLGQTYGDVTLGPVPRSWAHVGVASPIPSAAGVPAPVAFSGSIVCGSPVRTGVDESTPTGPVRLRTRGWAWQPTATMSDPRLEGDYYISYDSDDYESDTVTSVGSGTWRIENHDGAWQGSFTNIKYPDSTTIVSTALVGEGAYRGLTAVWESTNRRPLACAWEVRGLILWGDVPAAPEAYSGT
jgi:hypothetical protein